MDEETKTGEEMEGGVEETKEEGMDMPAEETNGETASQ